MLAPTSNYVYGFIFIAFINLFSQEAFAHTRSVSYSSWLMTNDEIVMTFSAPAREVTKLKEYKTLYPDLSASLNKHLLDCIILNPEGSLVKSKSLITEQGTIAIEQTYKIKANSLLAIEINAFYEVSSNHTHYATHKTTDGKNRSIILNQNNRSFEVIPNSHNLKDESFQAVLLGYINLGFTHILSGFDHLVFLLVLLLLCRSLKELIFTATGFTIGHSLTLFLAASNLLIPNIKIIESLIGLTIVIAAIEAIRLPIIELKRVRMLSIWLFVSIFLISFFTSYINNSLLIIGMGVLTISYLRLIEDENASSKYRPLLATIFGIIHGFGFANILNEIGIIKANFLLALFGFNIGVELGQILVLSVLWYIYVHVKKNMKNINFAEIRSLLSSILLAIGLYWFITRSFI
jgi:hypothetical protein